MLATILMSGAKRLAGFLTRDRCEGVLGQLIALLLVAQWLESRCASQVAQVRFMAFAIQSQIKNIPTLSQ